MAAANEKSDAELIHELLSAERKLMGVRMKHRSGQLENTAELGQARRTIARLHTQARARERERGLPKDSLLAEHRLTFKQDAEGTPAGQVPARGGFLSGIVDKLSGQQ